MIQLNLLPDVKLAYVKARRLRRTVVVVSVIVAGSCFVAMTLLFVTVQFVQRNYLTALNNDITTNAKALESNPNLNKILTIQNQLNNLTALHDQKPVVSRVFKYVQQITPKDVTISSINLDLTTNTISISGNASSVALINQYVDTMKFTTYKTADGQTGKAFSQVVLSSFSIPTGTSPASYSITASYEPVIFSSQSEVQLVVPTQITTRSETEKPTLFQQGSGGGQ